LSKGRRLCGEVRFGAVAGIQDSGYAHVSNLGKLIVFVLSGKCRVDYVDSTKKHASAIIEPGTVLYLGKAPFSQYYDDSCERIGISITGLRMGLSYHRYRKGEAYPNCPDIYLRGSLADGSELEDLLALLDKRASKPERTDAFTCSIPRMVSLALLEYFQRTPALRPESSGKLLWEQIRDYLEANYSQRLNRESVAEKFKLSEERLSRLFQKKTGLTFSQTLLKLRMEHAKKALQTGDFSVKEVAYGCGYRDFSYFTKAFKKYFKVLPKSVASQGNDYTAQDLSSYRRH
jgi:AraC-like DNA-binding protein